MYTAIHDPIEIDRAQRRLLQRIREALWNKLPGIRVGTPHGSEDEDIVANNRIWFLHYRADDAAVPRNWNAFGTMPVLRSSSNNIVVEVNMALDGVNRQVTGLFADNVRTGNTILLHRGRFGGKRRKGVTPFLEWYRGTKVDVSDGKHNGENISAIFVADLESSEFLSQLESFVYAVRSYKSSLKADHPRQMSDGDLEKKVASASGKPKSSQRVSVVYERDPAVAELAKRRAGGKCELCGKKAPFTNALNVPYLESHHIIWLAHGGSDQSDNTVALCPNCHRKMHVVKDLTDIKKLKSRVQKRLAG